MKLKNIKKKMPPKFNNKKGVSLLELLVAVIILAIVVSATATGLAASYRSVQVGAEKDKDSSLTQKYCDIIMSSIQTKSETDLFNPAGSVGPLSLTDAQRGFVENDTVSTIKQYKSLTDIESAAAAGTIKKDDFCYVIDKKDKVSSPTVTTYDVYTVHVYAYYTDTAYVEYSGKVKK